MSNRGGPRSDKRFEESIDINARQQRVWEVLSDLEAWPRRIETVDVVELLTPASLGEGSKVRLKQPKLPEGTWDVTVWDAPTYFEFRQKSINLIAFSAGRTRSKSCPDLSSIVTYVATERVTVSNTRSPCPRN